MTQDVVYYLLTYGNVGFDAVSTYIGFVPAGAQQVYSVLLARASASGTKHTSDSFGELRRNAHPPVAFFHQPRWLRKEGGSND